jgi:tRNA dimethylallyltransferase
MMRAGLLDEVRALRAAGYAPPLRSQQAIGYAELHRHLAGELSLSDAVALIQRSSRQYAPAPTVVVPRRRQRYLGRGRRGR